jgi:hypothetical protein
MKDKEIVADGCKIFREYLELFLLAVEKIQVKTVAFKQFAQARSFGELVRIHTFLLSFRLL